MKSAAANVMNVRVCCLHILQVCAYSSIRGNLIAVYSSGACFSIMNIYYSDALLLYSVRRAGSVTLPTAKSRARHRVSG